MPEDLYIPYAKQSISDHDREMVKDSLLQNIITRGPLVETFERELASYCKAEYAVAFNSGTAALMAAYHTAECSSHDRVLTTPNSFVATIGPAIQSFANPVFIDIDRSTGNFNLEQAALNLNVPHSRGKTIVVPVHFSGIPVDMEELDKTISDYKTVVIEDAAHAIGSSYKDGTKVGSCRWSQMTIFSFHASKTITTGEGGAVTTNDPELYHRLQLYRTNGAEKNPAYLDQQLYPGYYEVKFLSGNYNFTEVQAALGLSQLKRIDRFVEKRKLLIELYREKLSSFEHLRLLSPSKNMLIAHHLCVVQIDFSAYKVNRKQVMEKLHENGIGSQVHYIPLYRHPYFTKMKGDISNYFPEMEAYFSEAISLPLYYDLTFEEVEKVIKNLKKALRI